MLRQYRPQTFRLHTLATGATVPVGTVPIGTIVRLGRDLVMVEGWYNRVIGAARRGADGRYESGYGVGGHLAAIRYLRTGGRGCVNEHTLRHAIAHGDERTLGKGRARRRARA